MIYDSQDGKTPHIHLPAQVFDMEGEKYESIVQYRMQNRFTSDAISGKNSNPLRSVRGTFTYSIDLRRVYNMAPGKQYRVRLYIYTDFTKRNVLYSKTSFPSPWTSGGKRPLTAGACHCNRCNSIGDCHAYAGSREEGHGERMLKFIDVRSISTPIPTS
jgi:hypothetical protein